MQLLLFIDFYRKPPKHFNFTCYRLKGCHSLHANRRDLKVTSQQPVDTEHVLRLEAVGRILARASENSKEAHACRRWTSISVEGYGFLNVLLVLGQREYLQGMNGDVEFLFGKYQSRS